jgi:histidine triad (HIT) family protein
MCYGYLYLNQVDNKKEIRKMQDCLFCKIIAGQIPSSKVFEDEHTLIFKDISPKAPTHLLAIPKEHYATVQDIPIAKMGLMIDLFNAVGKIVKQLDLGAKGYRLVINSGEQAGQAVPHLHVHILAGRHLAWPPG